MISTVIKIVSEITWTWRAL